MSKKIYTPLFALSVLSAHLLFAEDKDNVEFSRPVMSMSQEGTHIVKGGVYIKHDGGLDNLWVLPTSGNIDFQAKRDERLGLEVMVAATYFSASNPNAFPQNYVRNISVSMPRLDASYIYGDLTHPLFRVDVGIFNYKYNENARNLGEYMFRTWAYPGFIQTGNAFGYVGNSSATVTGLKISQSLGMFSHEFLASLETEMTPIYDLNLTYMAKFNYRNILKVGGGVQLARALSNYDPPEMTVHYFELNGKWYPFDDKTGGLVGDDYYTQLQLGIFEKLNSTGLSSSDSTSLSTQCNCAPQGSKHPVSTADSIRLTGEFAQATQALAAIKSVQNMSPGSRPKMHDITSQAIKPVMYFSFDPKPLMGSNLFGPKDLIVYGEAAILGTKNYPVYYKDIWQRIPMMLGFNVPTFKVLDVLSVEAEYYGSRLLPAYKSPGSPAYTSVPVPFLSGLPYYPSDWDKDNLKWSIYAERTLVRGVTLSAQAASDHSRSWDWFSFGKTNWEMYTTPSHWYWAMKLGVKI